MPLSAQLGLFGMLALCTMALLTWYQPSPLPIGALVESVVPGGPAALAGLRPGDLVVAFDRERVEYADQLARWVRGPPPGPGSDRESVRDGPPPTARARLETRAREIDEGSLS